MSDTWQKVKISDVCDSLDNKRIPISKEAREKGNIPYYGATGIVDFVKDYIFDEKLLLVGEDGADWSSNANTAYLINGKSWVNNHAHVLRCVKINDVFLKEYINYQDFSDLVGGSTRGKLTKGDLEKILVPFPSLEIQQKIALILSTLDEQIQKTEKIIKKTEKLKTGVLTNLFSDSDVKNVKLDSITLRITDGTHRTPKYLDSGVPFLRINDIQQLNINWSKAKRISRDEHLELIRRCNPEKGDVLLSKNGTIGITKVVDWDEEFSIFVSLCLIKPNKDFISPDYLNLVLGSEYVMNQVKKRSKQGTVTNLHLEEIRDFNIPLPSIDRQKEIVEKINLIDLKINNEKYNFDKLISLKNGLMNDIFSQKVEVNYA